MRMTMTMTMSTRCIDLDTSIDTYVYCTTARTASYYGSLPYRKLTMSCSWHCTACIGSKLIAARLPLRTQTVSVPVGLPAPGSESVQLEAGPPVKVVKVP